MAIDVNAYKQQFLTQSQSGKPFNDSAKYGVQVKSLADKGVTATSGQYWRVVGIHHLTGAENMGNHHVYCDVLDENGERINQSRVVLYQDGTAPLTAVVDKPPNEAGTNFPLWKSSHVAVAVQWPAEAPLPSEDAINVTTEHPDEEEGNTLYHHSFYITWQRTEIKSAPSSAPSSPQTSTTPPRTTTPPASTTPPSGLEQAIVDAGEPQVSPVDPNSRLYKIAAQRRLGQHLTPEYHVTHDGKQYVAQVYEGGIVYAEDGNWRTLKVILR